MCTVKMNDSLFDNCCGCYSNLVKDKPLSLTDLTTLVSTNDPVTDKENCTKAELFLNSFGVKTRTEDYGYIRNAYDILVDLGKYLSSLDTMDLTMSVCLSKK